MSPELRKRMEEAALNNWSEFGEDQSVCFEKGAEWMHREEVVLRDDKILEVVKFCLPHLDKMWAATVLSKLLDCDFRDSEAVAKMYLGEGGEG